MKYEFTKFSDGTKINILEYCNKMIKLYPDVKIYVGCDSQNHKDITNYVTAVVFRFPNKGASVIIKKERVKLIRDMWSKLWGELQRSIDVAGYIKFEGKIPIEKIELDFNENSNFDSNVIFKAAIGYVEQLGYSVSYKDNLKDDGYKQIRNNILMSTWIADKACRK